MPELTNIDVEAPEHDQVEEILTGEALAFLAQLHRRFEPRRQELLAARNERQARLDAGGELGLLEETREVREGTWQVAPPPEEVAERRVEITGPTDRKMMINALNSGAEVFMADFEDSNVPLWANLVEGQVNLRDAVAGTIRFEKADGTVYELDDEIATLFVRPRGLHLDEPRLTVDGEPVAGAFMDVGLYLFHNARVRAERGQGTYFYLPKLESHLEARLWDEVFSFAEDELGLDRGTLRATVLIETLPAAFEMEEILHELREHSLGLNAGRWDYIFSCIKTYRERDDVVFPDRGEITMTVPFMRAYTERLVRTCHKRGAHAMGGMAAYIPNRHDPERNREALAAVRKDKEREAGDGFDGTWVAHPGLVEVAREAFDPVLGEAPNQIGNKRHEVDDEVPAKALTDFQVPGGEVTEEGLRLNVNVGLQYIGSWLNGWGAAAINNLMEDTATAEISRAQVWQWVHKDAALANGTPVTEELVTQVMDEELSGLADELGDGHDPELFDEARALFAEVALSESFHEFLTLPGMDALIRRNEEA